MSRRPSATSVFGILRRVARSESMHSDMIAWLLREDGSHDLGDAFACTFLRSIVAIGADQKIQIRNVHTEFPTSRGPVDILVEATVDGMPFAVAIENKIDAAETGDQLDRYFRGLRSQPRFKDCEIRLIFLTIDGSQPVMAIEDSPVSCVGYAAVRDTLRAATAGQRRGAGEYGFTLAQDYLELLGVEIMKDAEIAKICSDMYRDHCDAWRAIRRRLPSERDDLLKALADSVCQRFELDLGGEWRFSIQKDRYARVWRSDWERLGTRTDSVIAGVEGAHWTFAQTHFRLAVEPPAPDSSKKHFKYEVRIKWNPRERKIVEGLKTIDAFAKRFQRDSNTSTITVAANRRLPGMDADGTTVLDWIMTTPVRDVVEVIDSLPRGAVIA